MKSNKLKIPRKKGSKKKITLSNPLRRKSARKNLLKLSSMAIAALLIIIPVPSSVNSVEGERNTKIKKSQSVQKNFFEREEYIDYKFTIEVVNLPSNELYENYRFDSSISYLDGIYQDFTHSSGADKNASDALGLKIIAKTQPAPKILNQRFSIIPQLPSTLGIAHFRIDNKFSLHFLNESSEKVLKLFAKKLVMGAGYLKMKYFNLYSESLETSLDSFSPALLPFLVIRQDKESDKPTVLLILINDDLVEVTLSIFASNTVATISNSELNVSRIFKRLNPDVANGFLGYK